MGTTIMNFYNIVDLIFLHQFVHLIAKLKIHIEAPTNQAIKSSTTFSQKKGFQSSQDVSPTEL